MEVVDRIDKPSHSIIKYSNPEFVEIIILDEYKGKMEEAYEMFRDRVEIDNTKQLVLLDHRKGKIFNNEAGDMVDSEDSVRITKAIATIISNPILKTAANIMASFRGTKFPIKVFTRRDAALKWLLQQ